MSNFVKTNFEEIYKPDYLKKPMTPSEWVGGVSYLPVTRLKMTCGGGLGGSLWYEYVQRVSLEIFSIVQSPFVTLRTWDNKEVFLNKSYIVKAEQFVIASAVLNSRNPNFPMGEYTYCYLVEDGHKLSLV